MVKTQATEKKRLGLSVYLNLGKALVFAAAAVFLINLENSNAREQALDDAKAKAEIILERNLAIHTYFSHQVKPKVFALTDPYISKDYFEPAWMSSTYAVREIDKLSRLENHKDYYYKECAINARSPANEADAFEAAFIEELRANPELQYRSAVRNLEGNDYYVTLRRGEVLEESCMRCHSRPENAPKGLVDTYGAERSFNRHTGDLVSAISIRVPLATAYARADHFSRHLALTLVVTFLGIFMLQHLLYKKLIYRPIESLRDKTNRIRENKEFLGEEIPLPESRELADLASSFNAMSQKIRQQIDTLEEKVEERTLELTLVNSELRNAMAEITALEGILPVCCYCKNIRDDSGTEHGKGRWMRMEEYLNHKTGADVSHGCCPDCFAKHKDD